MMKMAVDIRNFSKRYQNFSIENMNLQIPKGYITGFIGRNGAGKTTTIKAMLNIINPDAGEVTVLGKNMSKHSAQVKNQLGVVLGEGYFYEETTVEKMKKILSPFYTRWDDDAFNRYAKTFELPLGQKISSLSKGMRAKLSIAFALSHHAQMFIMDEPTAGLDPIVREEILELFMGIMQNEEKTIFFSTHITSDLDKVADYIVLIDGGRILLQQPKDEALEKHLLVKGAANMLTEPLKKALISYRVSEYGFEGLCSDKKQLPPASGMTYEKPNIETLILYYSRRNQNGVA